jgi:hypothetical protein
MSYHADYNTGFISIVGTDVRKLQLLAGLSPVVDEPERIFSLVGSLIHETPLTWTTMYEVDTWVTSMARAPSGRLFAVDMDGKLHSTDLKGHWTVQDLGCSGGLVSLWVASEDELFAAGDSGDRVRIFKGQIEVARDPQNRTLNGVHGCSPEDVYMVGDEGLILQYRRGQWLEMEPPTNHTMYAVLCLSPREVYVAGMGGMIFRGNGDGWEQLRAPNVSMTDLAWYRGALYVAAGEDGVYRLEAQGLEKVEDSMIYHLSTIGEYLFGLGGNLVIRFDGSDWWGSPLNL